MNILRDKRNDFFAPGEVTHVLPDHIYIDANLYNNTFLSPTGPIQYIPAEIKQQRDSPYIFDPSYYNLAIARFSISSDCVPRTFQDVRTTSTTGTFQTREWVGLSYNGVYYDQPVVLPTVLDPLQQPTKAVFSIYAFLDVINAAWAAAQTAMSAASGITGPGRIIMTYNPGTELYTINAPAWFGTGGVGVTGAGVGVHMSFLLYQKFQSFNMIQNSPLLYNNHDVTFIRQDTGLNIINDGSLVLDLGTGGVGVTGVYIQIQQDDAWASTIIDAHRLLITTSTLPVYNEYLAVINPLATSNGNQTLPILTDFLIGQFHLYASNLSPHLSQGLKSPQSMGRQDLHCQC